MNLFSKQNREVLSNPLNLDNPIMFSPCRHFTVETGNCYGSCRNDYHGILQCYYLTYS